MPRKQRPGSRDFLAELARAELRDSEANLADRSDIFEAWKMSWERWATDTQIFGGPPHPEQCAMAARAIRWEPDGKGHQRPYVIDCGVLKSRQVGMSWFWMAVELWLLLFWPTSRIINNSQKYEEVDDGGSKATVRSLHGRAKFLYEHVIPPWLQRRCPLEFKRGQILTTKGGFALASAATTNVGRGGTFDMALLDEFAHVDWSDQVWAAVSQACKRGKVANSTPYGRGNEFFKLCNAPEDRDIVLLKYHWSKHPVYSIGLYTDADGRLRSPWYDRQCKILGSEELIAQELDMSFERSASARVYPEFRRDLHLQPTVRNDHQQLICAWDYGYAGYTCMILAQVERYADATEIQVLSSYRNRSLHIDAYVPVVGEWQKLYGSSIRHVGDPAGLAKSVSSARGPIQALAEHGIYTDAPSWLHRDAFEGIRLVKVALLGGRPGGLQTVRIRIDPSCTDIADSMENTTYPTDQNGVRLEGREMPADNEWTHMSDTMRYLVHYICRSMLGVGDVVMPESQPGLLGGTLTRTF